MRIYCKYCGKKLTITNTVQITPGVKDVYANCGNPDCLARTVYTIGFKADITPPLKAVNHFVAMMLNSISPDERRKLLMNYK